MPLLVIGFLLTLFLKEVKLSNEAGMVARGEAVAAGGAPVPAADPSTDDVTSAADDEREQVLLDADGHPADGSAASGERAADDTAQARPSVS